MARRRPVRLRRPVEREIDLSREQRLDGLEVIENDPLGEPPEPPPVNLLAGLPAPAETPYAKPEEDRTGTKGIWTAIENL